mgnify:CR=1 FL=1
MLRLRDKSKAQMLALDAVGEASDKAKESKRKTLAVVQGPKLDTQIVAVLVLEASDNLEAGEII